MGSAFTHRATDLQNGLKVVTVELGHLHTTSLVLYARVGSRHETPTDNGLSHFLEHMLFRGTESHPSSFALSFAIEGLGSTLHAETGRDYSLYQLSLAPENVEPGLELLAEIFRSPTLAEIELEREIVLEELNEDFDSNGEDINLDDLARAQAYPGHPLGQKITGPLENVQRFNETDLRRHLKAFYCGANLILCASGPVQHKRVVELAERELGGLPKGHPAETLAPDPHLEGPAFVYVEDPGSQTAIQILFRSLPEAHQDFVVMQTMVRILDDGMSTRLHYTLCDQLGLAYYVNSHIEPFHDTSLFQIDGATQHGKVGKLASKMLELCHKLRTEVVSPEELEKTKRRYRYDLHAAIDDVDAMAGWFGGSRLYREPREFDDKLAAMEKVTRDDILRVANQIFVPRGLVAAAGGELDEGQAAELQKIVLDWE